MGLKQKRVLITCGPTWVPIDDVRVISNISTGELGQKCALAFKKRGARITLLEGPVSVPLNIQGIRRVKYRYFHELRDLLKKELKKNFDIVLHAAAVSDYQLKSAVKGKISSQKEQLTLQLIPADKLIKTIKQLSPQACLVGFKLDPRFNRKRLLQQAKDLMRSAGCDMVVANSTKPGYRAFTVNSRHETSQTADSKEKLIGLLIKELENIP